MKPGAKKEKRRKFVMMKDRLLMLLMWLGLLVGLDSAVGDELVRMQLLAQLSGLNERQDREFLGNGSLGIAIAGMIGMFHCDERMGGIVDALGSEEMEGCEALNFTFSLWDTMSEPSVSLKSYMSEYERAHFVIGPVRSACTMPVGILASAQDVPIVSHTATSDELDDLEIFSSFYRTVPPDRATSEAMADLFVHYGLKNVAMVFVDDSYGNNFMNALTKACVRRGVTLHSFGFQYGDQFSVKAAMSLYEATRLNVLFVVAFTKDTELILNELYDRNIYGRGKLLIFGDAVNVDSLSSAVKRLPNLGEVVNGSQIVAASGGDQRIPAYVRLREAWPTFAKYVSRINALLPGGQNASTLSSKSYNSNTSRTRDVDAVLQIPEDYFSYSVGDMEPFGSLAYDASVFACRAVCKSYKRRHEYPKSENSSDGVNRPNWLSAGNMADLLRGENRSSFEFDGTTGRVRMDYYGSRDPHTVFFKLFNVFVDPVTYEADDVDVAYWYGSSEWVIPSGALRFPPGDEMNFPLQSDPPYHERNEISTASKAAAFVYYVIICIEVFSLAIWVFLNRKNKVVRKAQPEFLLIFLFGTLLTSSSLVTLSVENSVGCNLTIWFVSLGTTIAVTAIEVKLWRVYRLFTNPSLVALQIKASDLMKAIGILVATITVITLSWTLVAPLEWTRITLEVNEHGYIVESYAHCTYTGEEGTYIAFLSLTVFFFFLLYLFGAWVAYKVRNINTSFQESKWLGLALLFQAQLYLIGAPMYLAVDSSEVNVRHIVLSIVLFLSNFVTVMLLFAHKIIAVRDMAKQDEKAKQNKNDQQPKPNPKTQPAMPKKGLFQSSWSSMNASSSSKFASLWRGKSDYGNQNRNNEGLHHRSPPTPAVNENDISLIDIVAKNDQKPHQQSLVQS